MLEKIKSDESALEDKVKKVSDSIVMESLTEKSFSIYKSISETDFLVKGEECETYTPKQIVFPLEYPRHWIPIMVENYIRIQIEKACKVFNYLVSKNLVEFVMSNFFVIDMTNDELDINKKAYLTIYPFFKENISAKSLRKEYGIPYIFDDMSEGEIIAGLNDKTDWSFLNNLSNE